MALLLISYQTVNISVYTHTLPPRQTALIMPKQQPRGLPRLPRPILILIQEKSRPSRLSKRHGDKYQSEVPNRKPPLCQRNRRQEPVTRVLLALRPIALSRVQGKGFECNGCYYNRGGLIRHTETWAARAWAWEITMFEKLV